MKRNFFQGLRRRRLDQFQAAELAGRTAGRQRAVHVGDVNPLESQVTHGPLGRSGQREERILEHGGHDFRAAQVLSRPRPIGKPAAMAIQIPLARLVQHFQGVLEVALVRALGEGNVVFARHAVRPRVRGR